jgi:hypothetical protein
VKASRVILAALLVAAAASLVQTVVVRDGVGPLEYLASALVAALLLRTAVTAVRPRGAPERARRRPPRR